MFNKTIRKHLLYKPSLTNLDDIDKLDSSSHKKIKKSVHYSTSGLKKGFNDYNELSTTEHKRLMSAAVLTQTPDEITDKKENRKNKNNKNHERQDLEIMKIFTSPEWAKKSLDKTNNSIINSMVNEDNPLRDVKLENNNISNAIDHEAVSMESLDIKQDINDRGTEETEETEETDYVGEKKNDNPPDESSNRVQIFETEEKELENNLQESIHESMTENQNGIESFEVASFNSKTDQEYNMSFEATEDNIPDDYESRPSYLDEEYNIISNVDVSDTPLKEVDKSNYISNECEEYENQICVEYECYSYGECCEEQETSLKPDSEGSIYNWAEEILDDMPFNFDDLSDSYDSEIVDRSPTGSLNTDVMTRIIRQNKSRNYMTEKQMSNESAFREAVDLIFEETKESLGTLLIEGLFIVSQSHREDAFEYLGRWLLIQADIRNENKTEEESMSTF